MEEGHFIEDIVQGEGEYASTLSYIQSPQVQEIQYHRHNEPPQPGIITDWRLGPPPVTEKQIRKAQRQMTPPPPPPPKRFLDKFRKGPFKQKLKFPRRELPPERFLADGDPFAKRRYPDPRTLRRWSFHHPARDDPNFPQMDLLNFNLEDSYDRDKNPVLAAKSHTPSPSSIYEEMRILKREAEWDQLDRERAARGEPPIDRLREVRLEERKTRALLRPVGGPWNKPGHDGYWFKYVDQPDMDPQYEVSPGPYESEFELPLTPDGSDGAGPSNVNILRKPIKTLTRHLSKRGRVEPDHHPVQLAEDPTGEGRRELTMEPYLDFQASVHGSPRASRRGLPRTPSPVRHRDYRLPDDDEGYIRRRERLAREGKTQVPPRTGPPQVVNFHRDMEDNIYDVQRRGFPVVVDLRPPENRAHRDPLHNIRVPVDHPTYPEFERLRREENEDQERYYAERARRKKLEEVRKGKRWWNVFGGALNFPRWGRREEEEEDRRAARDRGGEEEQMSMPVPVGHVSTPDDRQMDEVIISPVEEEEPMTIPDIIIERYDDDPAEIPHDQQERDHESPPHTVDTHHVVSSDTETLTEHSPIPQSMRRDLGTPRHSTLHTPTPEAGPSQFPGSYPIKAPPEAEPPIKSRRTTRLLESPPPISELSSPSVNNDPPLKQVSRPDVEESHLTNEGTLLSNETYSSPGFDRSVSTLSLPPMRFTPLSNHIIDFIEVVKKVRAMPWIADRPTVDYVPRENVEASWRRGVEDAQTYDWIAADERRRGNVSWYNSGAQQNLREMGGKIAGIFTRKKRAPHFTRERREEMDGIEGTESIIYSAPPSVRYIPPSPTITDYQASMINEGMISIPVHTANGGVRRLIISAGAPRPISPNARSAQVLSPRTERTGPSRRHSRIVAPVAQPENTLLSQLQSDLGGPSRRGSRIGAASSYQEAVRSRPVSGTSRTLRSPYHTNPQLASPRPVLAATSPRGGGVFPGSGPPSGTGAYFLSPQTTQPIAPALAPPAIRAPSEESSDHSIVFPSRVTGRASERYRSPRNNSSRVSSVRHGRSNSRSREKGTSRVVTPSNSSGDSPIFPSTNRSRAGPGHLLTPRSGLSPRGSRSTRSSVRKSPMANSNAFVFGPST